MTPRARVAPLTEAQRVMAKFADAASSRRDERIASHARRRA